MLERAGLPRTTVEGRRPLCHLEEAPLQAAHAWIARYEHLWQYRLDLVDRALLRESPVDPVAAGAPQEGDSHERGT